MRLVLVALLALFPIAAQALESLTPGESIVGTNAVVCDSMDPIKKIIDAQKQGGDENRVQITHVLISLSRCIQGDIPMVPKKVITSYTHENGKVWYVLQVTVSTKQGKEMEAYALSPLPLLQM